jgi:RimJ/RimL family protein N-acetyltransferase
MNTIPVSAWLCEAELVGQFVTLEPLRPHHVPALQAAVLDGESHKLWFAKVPSPDEMPAYVAQAIAAAKLGHVAFAVRHHVSNAVVGTTRFYQVEAAHRRVALGYTWYAQSVRRTAVNTECKYLMLQHAFDTHQAIAVELQTHFFNHASRTAIERLGAKQDGILRSHQIMKDGSVRDTVVYSIIASEWSSVKNHLLARLAQHPSST